MLLFTLSTALGALKISVEKNDFLTAVLGAHGIVFGLILPLAIYSLIPAVIIWGVAWVIAASREPN